MLYDVNYQHPIVEWTLVDYGLCPKAELHHHRSQIFYHLTIDNLYHIKQTKIQKQIKSYKQNVN